MSLIDKQTTGLLYSYNYRIVDKEGRQYGIQGVVDNALLLYGSMPQFDTNVKFNQIGVDYFILARELDLTKEITVEGVKIIPIVELAKIHNPDFENYSDYQSHSGTNCYVSRDTHYGSEVFEFNGVDFCTDNLFDRNDYEGEFTKPVKNQLALFKKLNEWQYSHDLPAGSWKPIND